MTNKEKSPKRSNELLIGSRGAEIVHRTKIAVPDDYFYLKLKSGEEIIFLDAREYQIKKEELLVLGSKIIVERLEDYYERAKKVKGKFRYSEKLLLVILKAKKIKELMISKSLQTSWYLFLKKNKFKVGIADFSAERRFKTKAEFANIQNSQNKTEQAFLLVKKILEESAIKDTTDGKRIFWKGEILTSEVVKLEVAKFLLSKNMFSSEGIIVASDKQSATAHDHGHGPLLPNELIIVDIFPQDLETGYFGDMTRTFCKGTPSKDMVKLYEDVKRVQEKVLDFINVGVSTKDIYNLTVSEFTKLGHETRAVDGFTHGLGHSLGLNIHEYAPVAGLSSPIDQKIEVGDIMSVEPGLYYDKIGGVRIEDVIYVNENKKVVNMNKFEKVLVIN